MNKEALKEFGTWILWHLVMKYKWTKYLTNEKVWVYVGFNKKGKINEMS